MPERCDLESIYRAVTTFRLAIETADFDDLNFNLSEFPKNCCHHATALLRLYLFDQGFGLFDKAQGRRSDGREHVWLTQERIIVDITADQFDEDQPEVIVKQEWLWHNTWELQRLTPTDEAMIERNRQFYAIDYPIYNRIICAIQLI